MTGAVVGAGGGTDSGIDEGAAGTVDGVAAESVFISEPVRCSV